MNYKDKLIKKWMLDSPLTQEFNDWIIDEAERNHHKAVQMSGDLGEALSKIGDLEARLKDNGDGSGSLPQLITEYKDGVWIAWLKDCGGMVVQGLSYTEAVNEMMISIKVSMISDH